MENTCEICLNRESIASCRLCNRNVCNQHYTSNGLCSICSESLCSLCRKRLAITQCSICSKLVCEVCSRQVNPVVRICLQCYKGGYTKWPPRDILAKETTFFQEAVKKIRELINSDWKEKSLV